MKLCRLFCLWLGFIALAASAAETSTPTISADRVIAVVNSEAITGYDLKQRLSASLQQLRAQNIQPPAQDVMVKQVLERLIMDRIQLQYAKDSGLTVSDADLDAAMRRIAEGNNVSVSDMRTAIERDGLSWNSFRQDIRDQIILSRLRERAVDNLITVSDGEIDNYLANPPADTGTVNLAHILIRVAEKASPEELQRQQQRAEKALAEIKAGTDFGKVVASYSDAPDAMSGGVLGLRPLDRLPPLFAEVLTKLQVGDTSEILRSPAGFHIVKLLERQGGAQGQPMIKQTHARHILIKINETTSEVDARRKLATIKERLDNGADFAELAKLYSDDLSAAKGGDLGWLYQGDTVPEFEQAMDRLAPKEVSPVVQSTFGLHIIQVLERRVEAGSKERQRMTARMALRERKSDDAYQEWLRQQREEAYVEYRLEN